MCVVIGLVYYTQTHLKPLPGWLPLAMLSFLIATIILGGIFVRRFAHKVIGGETLEQRHERQVTAAKGLKGGIIVFSLIFLNDLRMLLQDSAAWKIALIGLTISGLFVVVCWRSLRHLRTSQPDNASVVSGQ
jgi:membrane protein implicated in regulation of membrane protease activity